MENLEWLLGEQASAVRPKGAKYWSIVENQDLPAIDPIKSSENSKAKTLNLGVLFLMQYSRSDLKDDPSIYFQNKLLFNKSLNPVGLFSLIFILLFSILMLWSMFLVNDFDGVEKAKFNFPSLFVFVGGFLSAQSFLSWLESWFLSRHFRGKPRLLHFSFFGLMNNTVAWSLGDFWKDSVRLIFVGLVMAVSSWVLMDYQLYLGVGLLLGFSFWIAYALMPLKPGPIDAILKRFLNIDEKPHQLLKWSIEGKLLPARQQIETKSSLTLRLVSAYLIIWLYMLLKFFDFLGTQLPESYYANAIFLEMFVAITGVIISLVFMAAIAFFYLKAWRYHKKNGVKDYEPSQQEVEYWQETSSLLFHVPILRNAPWKWEKVQAGTWLIKYGDTTRRFYWLQQGEAKVFGRRKGGTDVKLLTKLRAGSGFGELALLDNTPRSADVFISKNSVVASISHKEFDAISDGFFSQQFRKIVQASQLFDEIDMFKNTPSKEREEWLSRAILLEFNEGDVLFEEGDDDQWMGMVLSGEVRVERGGVEVSQIVRGQVFGEMSYIANEVRDATLIASEPLTIFRWESGWWAEQAEKVGLSEHFKQLMNQGAKV